MTTQMAAAASVPQTAPRRASRPGRIATHCREDQLRSLRQRDRWSRGSEASGGTGADGEAFKSSRAMSSSRGGAKCCEPTALYMELSAVMPLWTVPMIRPRGAAEVLSREGERYPFSTQKRGKLA